MNILALCCALNNTYLAYEYNNEIYSQIIKSDENYHSLYLISKIKEIDIPLNNFDVITVNCGPGSFTGIRVALSVAKIIAGELNKPLIPLNTSEILLNAFNAEKLIMDARRDMYFLGTKEKIELVYKDKIQNIENNNKLICDKRSQEVFSNAICFETMEKDLGKTMLLLAKEKYSNSSQKEEDFNYLKIEANYIQTPPIF